MHADLLNSSVPDVRQDDGSRAVPVLFVIGSLEIGGAETQLVEMACGLDRRFAPAICCLSAAGPLAERLTAAGIPVTAIGFRGVRQHRGWSMVVAAVRTPLYIARFVGVVRAQRPVILHGVLLHAYVLGALAAALTGVPVVIASRRSLSHFKRRRPLLRVAERVANRFTNLVIANSEAVRSDALAVEGLPPAKVIVIHNGLDVRQYERQPDSRVRSGLGLGPGPVVIIVANLIGYKGHSYFLRAWADVCPRVPGATAIFVGDGPTRAAMETEARTLGIDANVRWLGIRQDVPDLLALADLLVQPSLEEGFCNAIIEGMAAARPVVATRVGGNSEAVVDGVTGRLVPPRDPAALAAAMIEILERPDRGASMGQAGRRRVLDQFQRSRMVRRYEAVYDQLITALPAEHAHVRHQRAR